MEYSNVFPHNTSPFVSFWFLVYVEYTDVYEKIKCILHITKYKCMVTFYAEYIQIFHKLLLIHINKHIHILSKQTHLEFKTNGTYLRLFDFFCFSLLVISYLKIYYVARPLPEKADWKLHLFFVPHVWNDRNRKYQKSFILQN